MLQQRPARIITQAAAETIAKIETPQPAQTQRIVKSESKTENTPVPSSQKHKVVRDENTPHPAQNRKVVKRSSSKVDNTPKAPIQKHKVARDEENTPKPQNNKVISNKNTPSPFSLASHSRQYKTAPRATPRPIPQPVSTPRVPKLEVSAITYKKEPTDDHLPSSSIASSSSAKRAFVDLSNDTSSDDDDDETPSKAPRMG